MKEEQKKQHFPKYYYIRWSQSKDFLQPKMHYCNTPSELHIRLEYDAPVNTVNNMHLLQKVGVGHLPLSLSVSLCISNHILRSGRRNNHGANRGFD